MFTRSGLGVAIAAVVLAVCGVAWRYEELVLFAVAMGVALAMALWSSRVKHGMRLVRLVASPRVARGDPIRVVYRASNPGRRATSTATLIDTCDGTEVRLPLPSIGGLDRIEVSGSIPTRRRGVFDIGPWVVERVDPLGLAVGSRTGEALGSIIVHPRIHQLVGPYGAMHTIEEEAVIRRAAADPLSGFVSLREYVDGDDPRLIHWPTSARMGTLMLREHVELRRPEFTVVLDAAVSAGSPDDFEEMVDVAASVAVHALRSGVNVTLKTTSREHPGEMRPIDRETHVLDLLTPIQQVGVDASLWLAEIFQGGIDHTMIVFITGPEGPSSTIAHTDKLSVIRIGRGAVVSQGVAMAAEDAETFVRRWRPWH